MIAVNQGSANVISVSGLNSYYNGLVTADGVGFALKEGQVLSFFHQQSCWVGSLLRATIVNTRASRETIEKGKRRRRWS
jgi:ABC-type phosphonate transport system ATPase subunit